MTKRISQRQGIENKWKPSCVTAEVEARRRLEQNDGESTQQRTGGSVLGRIHLDLAKYYEMQRFSVPGADGYDQQSALFHLRHSADCGHLEAIITMGRMALQLPHDVLSDVTMDDSVESHNLGIHYCHLVRRFYHN